MTVQLMTFVITAIRHVISLLEQWFFYCSSVLVLFWYNNFPTPNMLNKYTLRSYILMLQFQGKMHSPNCFSKPHQLLVWVYHLEQICITPCLDKAKMFFLSYTDCRKDEDVASFATVLYGSCMLIPCFKAFFCSVFTLSEKCFFYTITLF